MCGFVGVFLQGRGFLPPQVGRDVDAASSLIQHRGPDEAGSAQEATYAIAHRRLSIIDLDGSHQPMGRPGDLLAFNGEILNYRELRESKALAVRGEGDTEVLLALLRADGVSALPSVRGQYSFAWIHDDADTLTLARDPLGILPAYYAIDGERIVFGSEIKAILPLLSRRPAVDRLAVAEYLVTRAAYAPFTMYEGIFKLQPGEVVHFSRGGRTTRESVLPPTIPTRDPSMSLGYAVDQLDALLQSSVAQALTADVPVGCFLSGGVDSSLITALARERVPAVHTFAAGFSEEGFIGELWAARHVANSLGTTHHEIQVSPSTFIDSLSHLSWHRDAPLSEPADVAVAALAREASNYVRVVLSGEGADELFLGYPKHRAEAVLAPLLSRPGMLPVSRTVSKGFDLVPNRARRLRVVLRAAASPSALERWLSWFGSFGVDEAAEMVGVSPEDIIARMRARQERLPARASTSLDAMTAWDLRTWLPDNLLERGERMTMAASVELRPPYLDGPVVAFAQRVPTNLLLGGGGKLLLRGVAQRYLPPEVSARPKAGFPMPLATWFSRSGFLEAATSLDGTVVDAQLSQQAVDVIAARHRNGQRDESSRLWTLLSLLAWARQESHAGRAGGSSQIVECERDV